MDPDSTSYTVILFILLFVYAFFAAAKEAIVSLRRSRRSQLTEAGHRAAHIIAHLADDTSRLQAAEQLSLKTLGFIFVLLTVEAYVNIIAATFDIPTLVATALVVTLAVITVVLLGELIPREIGRHYAEPIALSVAPLYRLLAYLSLPLSQPTTMLGRLISGRWQDTEYNPSAITEEELLSYVDAGEEEGIFQGDVKEMINSIFDLRDTFAREVMIPRIDIASVQADTPIMEALDVILEAGHSRVPVYVDNIDNVIGILYAKDLLTYWRNGSQEKVAGDLVREAHYVPESKPVSDLLQEMQTHKVHMAIVVDEYGGTAGLVTIEDILEEIVGEIQDEYDSEEFVMQYISDDEYIFNARMDLDDINNLMSCHLPTDDNDTLGGLVYNLMGRVPEVGNTLTFDDLSLTVLEVDGRRIVTVKVQRMPQENTATDTAQLPTQKPSSPLMGNTSQNAVSGSTS